MVKTSDLKIGDRIICLNKKDGFFYLIKVMQIFAERIEGEYIAITNYGNRIDSDKTGGFYSNQSLKHAEKTNLVF